MNQTSPPSPSWSSNTKLIVGLTLVAIIAALLIQFRSVIGPLILAVMLAYILYPVAVKFSEATRISWRLSVNMIYLVVLIIVLASFTVTGLAIVQQLQSLLGFIQRNVTILPEIVAEFSAQVYTFGPFEFNLAQYDLPTLTNQLLSTIQPILGRAGNVISSVAAGAAGTIGWGLFVLLISYFLLADANRVSNELVHIELPGYHSDLSRLGLELKNSWNAFFRGQLTLILLAIISYTIAMSILGMRFAIGIAILAGLGRLVPYLGPMALWIVTALVAYFQGGNYFGLPPWIYTILVLAIALIIDQVFDNLISPRLLGQTLGVHPAAVLISAIFAAQLIGLIGLLLAAPVVASLKLISGYVTRKMFDLDPWTENEPPSQSYRMDIPWKEMRQKIITIWHQGKEWFKNKLSRQSK